MKSTKGPDKRALQQLALGVQDIINEFDWLGFSDAGRPDGESPQETLPGFEGVSELASGKINGDAKVEEDQETESEYSTFDREDIEIGIDSLISRMIKKGLIDKGKTGRQPTLWRVFQIFYGESHPILELVDSFEQHIKGYFDTIQCEEMQAAFRDLLAIQQRVQRDLEASEHA